MKIIHVIFSFAPDGAETMLVDILNIQAKIARVKLIIINGIYNSELIKTIDKKVGIHYINRNPGSRNLLKVIHFNYLISKENPDIIHFHNHNGIKLLFIKRSSKTCLTIHSVNKPIDFLGRYDKLFSISNSVKNDIENRSSLPSVTIFNGIDLAKIKIKEACPPGKIFKIVVVSRLFHEVKGQHILLSAIDCLINKTRISNITVDLIGEGPSLKYLQELSILYKIEKYINFLGLQDRESIYNTLKNYDLLIQPSIYEGFGLTIVEAMVAKITVLASNTDGPSEIIQGDKFGFLFENGDPQSCAEAIKAIMLEQNSKELCAKRDRACEYANKTYSIQNTTNAYMWEYALLIQ